jgi:hypothetical protein
MSGGTADSASLSANSNLLQGTGSIGFATTASLLAVSSSQQQISSSLLNVIATYATTGSNSFRANQSITGSLVVSSTITAQTLVVQTVTSSIVYSSGSNLFGSALGDRQTFTGSIYQTGSIAAFAGSVGIGTTSPTAKLQINSSISDGIILATTTNVEPYIALQRNSATNGVGVFRLIDGGNLYFDNGATGAAQSTKMAISSSGNVGIGTTNLGPDGLSLPTNFNYTWSEGSGNAYATIFRQLNSAATVMASGYKRSSTGAFASSYGISMARAAIAVGYNNGSIAFFSDSGSNVANGTDITITEKMTITNAGNVGIGTASPASLLHLAVSSAAVDGTKGVKIANTVGTIVMLECGSVSDSFVGTLSASDFHIKVSNTNRISVTTAGKVGIGTTNPGQKLTIQADGGYGLIEFKNSSGTSNAYAGISDGAGNVFTTSAAGDLCLRSDTTGTIIFGYSNSEKIRINSSGNLGIGITAPSQKLHVVGGFLQTAGNSSWYRNVFEVNPTSWTNVVGFSPQSSPQYTYGYINITASAYTNGTSAGGVTTSRWYYSITNNSISVSVIGSDIATGSQAPGVRLTVSSGTIYVQVQSNNGTSAAYTSVFVDAMLASGYINGTYWIIA